MTLQGLKNALVQVLGLAVSSGITALLSWVSGGHFSPTITVVIVAGVHTVLAYAKTWLEAHGVAVPIATALTGGLDSGPAVAVPPAATPVF